MTSNSNLYCATSIVRELYGNCVIQCHHHPCALRRPLRPCASQKVVNLVTRVAWCSTRFAAVATSMKSPCGLVCESPDGTYGEPLRAG